MFRWLSLLEGTPSNVRSCMRRRRVHQTVLFLLDCITDICHSLPPAFQDTSLTLWHKARLGDQPSGGSFNSTGCSYIMSLHYVPTSCPYIKFLHHVPTLRSYIMSLHYAPTSCSYIMSLHYAPTSCPYITLLHHVPTLRRSYIMSLHYAPTSWIYLRSNSR